MNQAGQRDMDREMRELDRQEKYITAEIKKRAKLARGADDPALKSLAKNLVQVRAQRDKLIGARAHLGAVGMTANSMATQVAAASAMQGVTNAMKTANNAVDTKEINKIMNEFARQNETMAVREEMVSIITLIFYKHTFIPLKKYCDSIWPFKIIIFKFLKDG